MIVRRGLAWLGLLVWVGVLAASLFLGHRSAPFSDLKTGIISELSPEIFVIAKHGDDWLVEVNGVIARYDATKATIARRYPEFGRIEDRRASRAEWHGGRFAILEGDFFDAAGKPLSFLLMGTPSIVYQRLRILDLETAAESRIMVRRQATGGSGVAVIPSEMYTELIGGMFRYTDLCVCNPPPPSATIQ